MKKIMMLLLASCVSVQLYCIDEYGRETFHDNVSTQRPDGWFSAASCSDSAGPGDEHPSPEVKKVLAQAAAERAAEEAEEAETSDVE